MKTFRRRPALTQRSLARAVNVLTAGDQSLRSVVAAFGCPPLWERATGFPTLVYIILEQQVSLASARSAFDRLSDVGPVTPERFLCLSDLQLRAIGFSRQKAAYSRGLAQTLISRELNLSDLERLDDDSARAALTALNGIGPWTADIYLLMALCRPDVWPTGDIALLQAIQEVKELPRRPSSAEALVIAEGWRPWRAVAARVLWHWYLSTPRHRFLTNGTSRRGDRATQPSFVPRS